VLRPPRNIFAVWIRTGGTIALVDFLFASALSVYGYSSTFERLWQGVASVMFGPMAIGNPLMIYVGIAMHICVAFTWAGVFVILLANSAFLRRVTRIPAGVLVVATVYGPLIWCFMSFVWIPLFTHKTPTITMRWWIQIAGHVLFVGLPIVWAASHWLAALRGTKSEN
jgi:hypothetical protein